MTNSHPLPEIGFGELNRFKDGGHSIGSMETGCARFPPAGDGTGWEDRVVTANMHIGCAAGVGWSAGAMGGGGGWLVYINYTRRATIRIQANSPDHPECCSTETKTNAFFCSAAGIQAQTETSEQMGGSVLRARCSDTGG